MSKVALVKLAMVFGKSVLKHRKKLLHVSDVELLVHDLGAALDEQKNMLTNPRNSTIETAMDILPQIAEVRVLTNVITKHLDIDTKDKDEMDILKEIVEKMEERESDASFDIKRNLSWMEEFYSLDAVKELMEEEVLATEAKIEMPSSVFDFQGAKKMVAASVSKVVDKTQHYHKYMELAKQFERMQRRELAKKDMEENKKTDNLANDNETKENKDVPVNKKRPKGPGSSL